MPEKAEPAKVVYDACLRVCEQKGISAAPFMMIMEPCIIWMKFVSTGEIGALKRHHIPVSTSVFSTFSDSLFLIQENQELYQILPLIQHANTLQFHKVTHLFYLDNVSDEYGYRRLETLDECLDLFRGTLPQKRTADFLLFHQSAWLCSKQACL